MYHKKVQQAETLRPAQGDLEGLVSCDEGRKPGQTLLSRPPDPDQQGVPQWRPQNARDPHQVSRGVLHTERTDRKQVVCVTAVSRHGNERQPETGQASMEAHPSVLFSKPRRRPGPWLRPSPPR